MAHSYADYQQVEATSVSCEATDGTQVDTDCYVIPVLIPVEDVPDLLAAYDPASGTSPLVATARPLARVILDALLRKTQEGS